MVEQISRQELVKKWGDVLEDNTFSKITDNHRKEVTAQLLENTQREVLSLPGQNSLLSEAVPTTSTGNMQNFDPVLISLVRRTAPNLMAYDICGVQPMSGPNGTIFALRSRYGSNTGPEAFYNEANTAFTSWRGANATVAATGKSAGDVGSDHVGTAPGIANNAGNGTYNSTAGLILGVAEGLGSNATAIFPEMTFTIDKTTVTATSRKLQGEYSYEVQQDLKAIHGLDAENELSSILSTELVSEMNRELIRNVIVTAVQGSSDGSTSASGVFNLDTDSNGRWMVEKFKGLMFHLEKEANKIAKDTRRGKGNIIICSADVASALTMAGVLDYTPALTNSLQVDDTGKTFAGVLNGRFKVYIDPYAAADYFVMGYKGSNAYDSGIFYCPYVPMQKLLAQDPNTYHPKIAFQTRYAYAVNPFAKGLGAPASDNKLEQDSNVYYRRTLVQNIL